MFQVCRSNNPNVDFELLVVYHFKSAITLLILLIGFDLHAQALWRNFFTTNQIPVVDVVAGSNATVVASTPNSQTRRFTVSSIPPTVYGSNVVYNGSYTPFILYGTNIIVSPTNGPLQTWTITNVSWVTLDTANTVYTETVRLNMLGSNTITWATANLSNSAAIGPSNYVTSVIFDHSNGTNLWWGFRIK